MRQEWNFISDSTQQHASPIPLWQLSPAIAVILEHFRFGDFGAERWFSYKPINIQGTGFVSQQLFG
jgi:hypothetical protein